MAFIFDLKQTIRTGVAVLAGAVGVLASATKCVPGDDPLTTNLIEAVNCSATWLPPQYAAYAVMFFTASEVVLKSFRPGGMMAGWFGQSVLVVPKESAKIGVVTPEQVAATGPTK